MEYNTEEDLQKEIKLIKKNEKAMRETRKVIEEEFKKAGMTPPPPPKKLTY